MDCSDITRNRERTFSQSHVPGLLAIPLSVLDCKDIVKDEVIGSVLLGEASLPRYEFDFIAYRINLLEMLAWNGTPRL